MFGFTWVGKPSPSLMGQRTPVTGVGCVASGPMVRSSYKAGEFYMKAMLKENEDSGEGRGLDE